MFRSPGKQNRTERFRKKENGENESGAGKYGGDPFGPAPGCSTLVYPGPGNGSEGCAEEAGKRDDGPSEGAVDGAEDVSSGGGMDGEENAARDSGEEAENTLRLQTPTRKSVTPFRNIFIFLYANSPQNSAPTPHQPTKQREKLSRRYRPDSCPQSLQSDPRTAIPVPDRTCTDSGTEPPLPH